MAMALISLGSNLGDRRQTLEGAVALLALRSDLRVLRVSTRHETAPVGGPPGQPGFLNGALTLETSLGPEALLASLQQVEQAFDRRRDERWAARTLDLDLLLYDDLVVETPLLTIPHPRMAFRRFVLAPALEVAAEWVHPQIGWTLARLWQHLEESPRYVAVAGPPGVGKNHLAAETLTHVSGRLIAQPPDSPWSRWDCGKGSGLDWERQIEFLRECTRLLDVSTLLDPSRLTVSDFWFDQLLADAAVYSPAEKFEKYGREWEAARQQVAPPKLIVWLADETAESIVPVDPLACGLWPSHGTLGDEQLYRQIIAGRIHRPGQGPVLKLKTGNPQAAVAETVAAIQAMEATG